MDSHRLHHWYYCFDNWCAGSSRRVSYHSYWWAVDCIIDISGKRQALENIPGIINNDYIWRYFSVLFFFTRRLWWQLHTILVVGHINTSLSVWMANVHNFINCQGR